MRTKPLSRDAVLEFLRDVYMQKHALYTQTVNKIVKEHNLPRGFVYYLLHHSPIIKPLFVKDSTNKITCYAWNALNTGKKDIIPSLAMADCSITEYTSYTTTEQQRIKKSQKESIKQMEMHTLFHTGNSKGVLDVKNEEKYLRLLKVLQYIHTSAQEWTAAIDLRIKTQMLKQKLSVNIITALYPAGVLLKRGMGVTLLIKWNPNAPAPDPVLAYKCYNDIHMQYMHTKTVPVLYERPASIHNIVSQSFVNKTVAQALIEKPVELGLKVKKESQGVGRPVEIPSAYRLWQLCCFLYDKLYGNGWMHSSDVGHRQKRAELKLSTTVMETLYQLNVLYRLGERRHRLIKWNDAVPEKLSWAQILTISNINRDRLKGCKITPMFPLTADAFPASVGIKVNSVKPDKYELPTGEPNGSIDTKMLTPSCQKRIWQPLEDDMLIMGMKEGMLVKALADMFQCTMSDVLYRWHAVLKHRIDLKDSIGMCAEHQDAQGIMIAPSIDEDIKIIEEAQKKILAAPILQPEKKKKSWLKKVLNKIF